MTDIASILQIDRVNHVMVALNSFYEFYYENDIPLIIISKFLHNTTINDNRHFITEQLKLQCVNFLPTK